MLPYSSSSAPAAPVAQNESPKRPPHKSPTVIIASVLGVIVVAGAAFAVYYLFFRKPLPNVEMQVQHPEKVLLGEPFTLTVAFTNTSEQPLKNSKVALSLPQGVSLVGAEPSVRVAEADVGEVAPAGIGSRFFELVVTEGEEGASSDFVKRVVVAFRYALTDSQQARFETTAAADISVGGPAVALNFNVPQSVFPGQDFDVSLAYQNNSDTAFDSARLVLDRPQGFQLESATGTVPASGEGQWDLGILQPGARGEVAVTGRMNAASGSFFSLGAHLQVEIEGRTYDLRAQEARVGIASAPLSLTITAARDENYVAHIGTAIPYTLTYRNGSPFTLQNVVIEAELEGELFDISTVGSAATLNSIENTLTWNSANTPTLATLTPGATGAVTFNVVLDRAWPIEEPGDKDFTVRVKGRIRSLSVPAGISAAQTASSAELLTKVAGQAVIETAAYFKEPTDPSANSGPYPPRVNQATQYTVHWVIYNYSTDLTGVRMAATLQSGARMVKVLKSTAASSPVYNNQTSQVAWDISSITAGRGILNAPLETIFQIEATPAANQAGLDVPLLGQVTFTATDAFTGRKIELVASPVNSALPDDVEAATGDRRVQP